MYFWKKWTDFCFFPLAWISEPFLSLDFSPYVARKQFLKNPKKSISVVLWDTEIGNRLSANFQIEMSKFSSIELCGLWLAIHRARDRPDWLSLSDAETFLDLCAEFLGGDARYKSVTGGKPIWPHALPCVCRLEFHPSHSDRNTVPGGNGYEATVFVTKPLWLYITFFQTR